DIAEIARCLHILLAEAEVRLLAPIDIFLDAQATEVTGVAGKPMRGKKRGTVRLTAMTPEVLESESHRAPLISVRADQVPLEYLFAQIRIIPALKGGVGGFGAARQHCGGHCPHNGQSGQTARSHEFPRSPRYPPVTGGKNAISLASVIGVSSGAMVWSMAARMTRRSPNACA